MARPGSPTFPDQASVCKIYVKLDIVGPRAFELFQMLDLGDFSA